MCVSGGGGGGGGVEAVIFASALPHPPLGNGPALV